MYKRQVLALVHRYIDYYVDWFQIHPHCACQQSYMPTPNETVLHVRNFATEFSNNDHSRGLEDASLHETVHGLLGDLLPGASVAIAAGRRRHDFVVDSLVQVLRQDRQLQVRVMTGSPVQDWDCLRQTQHHLIGNFQSTYFFWAAVLSYAKNVSMYVIDSPRLRRRYGHFVQSVFGNLTIPRLSSSGAQGGSTTTKVQMIRTFD